MRKNVAVLNQILTEAVQRRRIAIDPAKNVELPQSIQAEKRYLSSVQVAAPAKAASRVTADAAVVGEWRYAKLTDAAHPRSVLVYLLAYAGLRFGEAAALRVSDGM
ncbi:hypothetical protein [Nocardia sp. CNY236]|uniref:hypothetical protein n=1 Tax=Nocardia sp. CNY236 TaxID=1169152 RepID=UPI00040E9F93|nr:hypothetical protein [Nocardia sp. CNY236]